MLAKHLPSNLWFWCWFQTPGREVWPWCLIPGVVNPTEPLPPRVEVPIVSSGPITWNLVIPKGLNTPLPTWVQVPICTVNISIRYHTPVVRSFIFSAVFNVAIFRGLFIHIQVSRKRNIWGIQVATISCNWSRSTCLKWLKCKDKDKRS